MFKLLRLPACSLAALFLLPAVSHSETLVSGSFDPPIITNQAYDPTPVTDGPAGTFSFIATYCNKGSSSALGKGLESRTRTLTGGNELLNRTSGSRETSDLIFPQVDDYADLDLRAGECLAVTYEIGLQRRARFQFFVDIWLNPTVTSIVGGPDQAIAGHTVQLSGGALSATSPTYHWVQAGFGPPVTLIDENTDQPSFVAPSVSITQSLEFTLTTTDAGATGVATQVVTIHPQSVGVDAGPDVQTNTDTPVSLHAVAHADSGAFLTYAWSQIQGTTVTIQGAGTLNPTFTTPTTEETLIFEVAATNTSTGDVAIDDVAVVVSLSAAPKLYSTTALAGTSGGQVTMGVQVAGGLPSGATVQWTQTKGPAVTLQGATGLTPSFTAPTVGQATDLEFRVELTTAAGTRSGTYQSVKINPTPGTNVLHVDAGRDQTAEAGDTLQLHADVLSNVASPGSLTYQWTQISGRSATLSNDDQQSVSVQLPAIPDVDDGQSNKLVFEVAVTDGVRSGTDTVEVQLYRLSVSAGVANTALASSTARGFLFTGDTVQLTSNVRRAKAPLTVTWTQTAGPAVTLTDADQPDASAQLTPAGSYTFEVTVTDALGNTDTDSVTVTANDPTSPPSPPIPSSTQLTASVTGGSTQTANVTFEGDQGITARVQYAGEDSTPTISWTQTVGPTVTLTPSVDGTTVQFDAPLVTVDTRLTLEAAVSDSDETVTVPVDYLIQDRPIQLFVDRVGDGYVGKSTTLHGRAQGGGGAFSYQWVQVSNGAPTVSLTGDTSSVANFTAAAPGTYVFELTVSDSLNNQASARAIAQVLPVPATPSASASTIDILFPQPTRFVEGTSVAYTAAIHDLPVGAQVEWTEVLGHATVTITPDGTDPGKVTLGFPAVPADTEFQLKVTVRDSGGSTVLKEATSDRMRIRDHLTTVAAQVTGNSAGIVIGDTVHLAANPTDTVGTVTYAWALLSGSGTLSGDTTATPSFVPGVAGSAELQVTVTDALGNTASAKVSVTAGLTPLVFTPPGEETRDWPADATKSAVTLHVLPSGGSGQYSFDYKLQVKSFTGPSDTTGSWEDNDSVSNPLALDTSNDQNPAVALTTDYFGSGNIATCKGTPCDTVYARLITTVTDTQSGVTKSGTTNITWAATKITKAQLTLVSTPPKPTTGTTPNCTTAQEADLRAAWRAAVDARAPIGEYECSGPPMICERLFHGETRQDAPDVVPSKRKIYGILKVVNHESGAREVTRYHGDRDEAYREWYLGTSDVDRCGPPGGGSVGLDFNFVITLDYQCTFAYAVPFGNGSVSRSACSIPRGTNGLYRANPADEP